MRRLPPRLPHRRPLRAPHRAHLPPRPGAEWTRCSGLRQDDHVGQHAADGKPSGRPMNEHPASVTRTRIESVRIEGFRSLRSVELSDLPDATVLIGANGSGKSNFIRFFEMLSWMLRSRRLGDFILRQGGADDQLYRGNRVTPRMEAEIRLRTTRGTNDYRFALSYASPDRFFFSEEQFRFNSDEQPGEAPWQRLEGGHREAMIVEAAQSAIADVNQTTAWVIVNLLRSCAVYQFPRHSRWLQLREGVGRKRQRSAALRWRQPGGRVAPPGAGRCEALRPNLPPHRAHPAGLRSLHHRRDARDGALEMERQGCGQDVRCASHVRRIAALSSPS